jgi:hypothetical protein
MSALSPPYLVPADGQPRPSRSVYQLDEDSRILRYDRSTSEIGRQTTSSVPTAISAT